MADNMTYPNYVLFKELADVLGFSTYDPYKNDEYLREAIHYLKEHFGE